jgi:hypothetical protein
MKQNKRLRVGTLVETKVSSFWCNGMVRRINEVEVTVQDMKNEYHWVQSKHCTRLDQNDNAILWNDKKSIPKKLMVTNKEIPGRMCKVLKKKKKLRHQVLTFNGSLRTSVRDEHLRPHGTKERILAAAVETNLQSFSTSSTGVQTQMATKLLKAMMFYPHTQTAIMILLKVLQDNCLHSVFGVPNLLFEAATIANEQLIRMFLNAGMDPNAVEPRERKTPYEIALLCNNGSVACILLEWATKGGREEMRKGKGKEEGMDVDVLVAH